MRKFKLVFENKTKSGVKLCAHIIECDFYALDNNGIISFMNSIANRATIPNEHTIAAFREWCSVTEIN
jgi:hypothetical protein